jgi:cytochrome b
MAAGILLGIVTLIGVIYLAVSRKSSFIVRISALVALGLMVIAVVVCLLLVFGVIGDSASRVVVLPDAVLYDAPPPPPGPNLAVMVMLIVFLIAVFVLVVILALKEKQAVKKDDW